MFKGAFTAIVTPFNSDGTIDFEAFGRLVERQAAAGVDGIVPVGTTGESPTLNTDEHIQLIEKTVEFSDGRLKIIAGTGANSTSEAVELTGHAKDAGVDGTLQVTPYYNKPSQEGLYRHFSAVADIGLPVVLYNVPGRAGTEIEISTVARLSEHPNVVCVKEAGGSVDRVSAIVDACDIGVVSGDDSLTLPMMSVGAKGVISVTANVIPSEVTQMVHAALDGDLVRANELHGKFYPLFRDLFVDTNPIPVKAAMAMMGLIEETYRLPLCEMSDDCRAVLKTTMSSLGLL